MFVPGSVPFHPLPSVFSQSMFSSFGIYTHRYLYGIYWQITQKETILEVAFGIKTSGHCSKVKRGKKPQVITFYFGSFSKSQAWELAMLGFLSL